MKTTAANINHLSYFFFFFLFFKFISTFFPTTLLVYFTWAGYDNYRIELFLHDAHTPHENQPILGFRNSTIDHFLPNEFSGFNFLLCKKARC